ncbi:MAG TPA: hypothetical protein VHH11_02425 [Gammaproteobacteria bacterium]|jgi:hypothetical protein|nr:hypothetical protein [Gammaproteobacteria bacterium]
MTVRDVKIFALLFAALALAGCNQGQKAPLRTNAYVVNVAPDFAALGYRREQTDQIDSLDFKGVVKHDYGADTYDFFVYQRTLTNDTLGSWTFTKQLVSDKNYVFVLAEAGGQVSPQIVEYPVKIANSGDSQFVVMHAGENLPTMDVYITPAGTGIVGAAPRGTLSFLGQTAATTLTNGTYDITLTAAGDPSTVLFTSSTVNLAADTTNVFVITPEGGAGTETMSIAAVQDSSYVLYSTNATSALRVINAAGDQQPRDVAINHEFSPPLFPSAAYATATAYQQVPVSTTLPVTATPPGNPGVLELDTTTATYPGQKASLLLTGPTGTLALLFADDDGRRIVKEAKVRYIAAATQFATATDFVLLPPGTADQTTIAARTTLVAPAASTGYDPVVPGTYELLLREVGTNTVRAGPITVNLVEGGLYTILSLNGADGTTSSVAFLDDQP